MSLDKALNCLKRGEFILIHDDNKRENEIDMVAAAEYVTPEHIARLRKYAGGLICIAIDSVFGKTIGVEYMHNILSKYHTIDTNIKKMIIGLAPYGDKPSFSITINHIDTYTGVTDKDRAHTIKEMALIYNSKNQKNKFISSFKTPGHVPLLIASDKIVKRQGHTELSICMAKLANIIPVTVICEMLDSKTYSALSVNKAIHFAKQNSIPFIEAKELLEFVNVYS